MRFLYIFALIIQFQAMSKSLEEVNQSVQTQNKSSIFRKILAFFALLIW